MKVFIAGIMQGNRKDGKIHSQNYRKKITGILMRLIPELEVVDPDITDPDRLKYTNEQASEMFLRYNLMMSKVDLVIAYIPKASMGTAVEMWEAWKNKVLIITISPLKHNWVVKLLSARIYSTIKTFSSAIKEEELRIFLDDNLTKNRASRMKS